LVTRNQTYMNGSHMRASQETPYRATSAGTCDCIYMRSWMHGFFLLGKKTQQTGAI